jgi:hypothetical protein
MIAQSQFNVIPSQYSVIPIQNPSYSNANNQNVPINASSGYPSNYAGSNQPSSGYPSDYTVPNQHSSGYPSVYTVPNDPIILDQRQYVDAAPSLVSYKPSDNVITRVTPPPPIDPNHLGSNVITYDPHYEVDLNKIPTQNDLIEIGNQIGCKHE